MDNHHITNTKECMGCALCAYICPVEAISLRRDSEGFQIPIVDEKKCISCGKCIKNCPISGENKQNNEKFNDVYALQLKNEEDLKKTASGGAFFGIAEHFIKNGGVVFGVADNVEKGSYFMHTSVCEEVVKMVGSKYYQCDLKPQIYTKINNYIQNMTKVLFVGTPCQVDAVKRSINPLYANYLYTMDIICQGVPSIKIVDLYHKYIEKKYKNKVKKHFYRSKEKIINGDYTTKLVFSNGAYKIIMGQDDLYTRSFSRKIFLRESCFGCKFTNLDRISDITIGDFWGIKDAHSFKNNLGISVAIINTQRGEELLKQANNSFIIEKKQIQDILPYNIPLTKSAKRKWYRSLSYKMVDRIGFPTTTKILCFKYYIKKLYRRK